MTLHAGKNAKRSALASLAILMVGLVVVALAVPLALAAPAMPLNPLAIEGPVAAEYAVVPAAGLAAFRSAPLNVEAARAEDAGREANGLPPRFAIGESTWLTPANSGSWETLDERHDLWRARISAPGALSLNLGFTGFHLPKGARLSLYPVDVQGADDIRGFVSFTAQDNEDHGELWTPVILSDEIVVELVMPRSERDNFRLELTAINQGYRYFGEELAALEADKAGTCNIDVVCPEGDDWRLEINSVGVISTGGTTFCTGSMLNNTAQDGTPYFLTANHCGIGTGNAASLVVYWNFQSPTCGAQSGGLLNQFMTGSVFLAASATSDLTLVRMDDPVDPLHEVSFAGWDKTGANLTSATAIHHPNTDEKSISFEYDATTITTYLANIVPGDGSHIRVIDWDVGTTEPGSSGSPLFDQNHRVVGQLHGGYAACGNNSSDWYGRLFTSWPQIAAYLDPLGTSAATLDTYAPWAKGLVVTGADLAGAGDAGGPFAPASTVYTLKNIGTASFSFQVTADVAWVVVSGGSGTLAAGASTTVGVSYGPSVNSLPNGLYTGVLSFVNLTDGEGDAERPVKVTIGLPRVVHSFPLDANPGWTMGGQWDWGVPAGAGGTAHGGPDPSGGYTGANVLGYNLAGDYPDNLPETHLVTTAIDCSGLTGTSLRFQRWLNVEQPAYDHASVAVSIDNVNFTTVWQNTAQVNDTGWVPVSYDISAVADRRPTVYLRWTMGATDDSWQFSGWNIDDIEVWGLPGAVSAVGDLPGYRLGVGSYPNPFNPQTRIDYVLAQSGPATVRVYDLQGRLVRTLVEGPRSAGPGSVMWDGRSDDGQTVSSGIYFAQVVSGGERAGHKMLLLK